MLRVRIPSPALLAVSSEISGSGEQTLGFAMTNFQKIAASSFAAVHRTIRRRLIAITVQEGLMHDEKLDIDARDTAFIEARQLILHEFNLPEDRMGQVEAERLLADMKRRMLKKMDDEDLAILSSEFSFETATTASEVTAVMSVELALPEEREGELSCMVGIDKVLIQLRSPWVM